MFSRYVDISSEVQDRMTVWPGDPEVSISPVAEIRTDGYKVTRISLGTHTGTHVDFPGHILEGASKKPDLSSMLGPCEVVMGEKLPAMLSDESFCPVRLILKGKLPTGLCYEKLISKGLMLIGTESQSIDEQGSLDCHKMLLNAEVVILEGLNLEEAEEGRCFLIALPLKIDADDGSPARAVLAY
jgi:arylformamidase